MNSIRSQSGTDFGRYLSAFSSEFQYSRFIIQYSNPAFEDDVAALASWKIASHVEVPLKKEKNGNGGGNDDPPKP